MNPTRHLTLDLTTAEGRAAARADGLPVPPELDGNVLSEPFTDEVGRGPVPPKGKSAVTEAFLRGCQAHGLPTPKTEYHFAKGIGRRWRFDFLFDGWLAVEVCGGIYGRGKACPTCGRKPVGAHTSIAYLKTEHERTRWAVILGYCVFPCRPEEVQDGSVFPLIAKALESRK